jgi:hypothetical protein
MKMTKYFIISLAFVGFAYGVGYTATQERKLMEMLNFLQLNAQCAQASTAILTASHAVLTDQEKDAMRDQIKLFAENLVKYQAFLKDLKEHVMTTSEKVKEITPK